MSGHQRDALPWVLDDIAAQGKPHDHLLLRDPYQLGWRCQVEGCRFFMPPEEFDEIKGPADC